MPRSKRKSAGSGKPTRDIRDHFAELCEGDVAFTRHASRETLDVIARNQDAWHVYLAFTRAVRRGSKSDLAQLRQQRSRFARARNEIELRRAHFVTVIERAVAVRRSDTSGADEKEMALLDVASMINVELEPERRFEEIPWSAEESGGHSNWPVQLIQTMLDEAKLPDATRPRGKRGGRATFGATAVAAKLSRRFGLFGDGAADAQANPDVAKKYKKARRRRT